MQGALKKEHVAQRRIELTTPRFMKQQCLPLCRNQTKVFFYYILSSVKCHHVNNSLPNSPGTKIRSLLYELQLDLGLFLTRGRFVGAEKTCNLQYFKIDHLIK